MKSNYRAEISLVILVGPLLTCFIPFVITRGAAPGILTDRLAGYSILVLGSATIVFVAFLSFQGTLGWPIKLVTLLLSSVLLAVSSVLSILIFIAFLCLTGQFNLDGTQ